MGVLALFEQESFRKATPKRPPNDPKVTPKRPPEDGIRPQGFRRRPQSDARGWGGWGGAAAARKSVAERYSVVKERGRGVWSPWPRDGRARPMGIDVKGRGNVG